MKLDPLDELAAKLFAAAREEEPDAALLERVSSAAREAHGASRAADSSAFPPASARPRAAPAPRRRARFASSSRGWLPAAAVLAARGGLVWLGRAGSREELAISAEREPRRTSPSAPSASPSPSAPLPA